MTVCHLCVPTPPLERAEHPHLGSSHQRFRPPANRAYRRDCARSVAEDPLRSMTVPQPKLTADSGSAPCQMPARQ